MEEQTRGRRKKLKDETSIERQGGRGRGESGKMGTEQSGKEGRGESENGYFPEQPRVGM